MIISKRRLNYESQYYVYRSLRMQKNPIDLAIYLELLWHLKPRTIIEIGSLEGGSALWFADQQRTYGIPPRVISIDIKPPALIDPDIEFLTSFNDLPVGLKRPYLCVEDSAHTYAQTLASIHAFVRIDADYIVVEDMHVRAVRHAVRDWLATDPKWHVEHKSYSGSDNAYFQIQYGDEALRLSYPDD